VFWYFGTCTQYLSISFQLSQKEEEAKQKQNKGCVPLWPLPLTFKSILMQKKNYENSNISLRETKIFKKSSKRNQIPSRY
jgi:hypothetical protein